MRIIRRKAISWLLVLALTVAYMPSMSIIAMATTDENPLQEELLNETSGQSGENQSQAGAAEGETGEEGQSQADGTEGENGEEGQSQAGAAEGENGEEGQSQADGTEGENGEEGQNQPEGAENQGGEEENQEGTLAETTAPALMLMMAPLQLLTTPLPAAVTLGNEGYPYGSNMSSGNITLNISIESGEAASYQWQKAGKSAAQPGDTAFSNIENATGAAYTFAPEDGAWYRCVVNENTVSEAVQAINPNGSGDTFGRMWTKPYGSWYISNGTMAYMVSGAIFDVTGYYAKGANKYMLCTSYSTNWCMFTSEPEDVYNGNAALDEITFAFSDSDDYRILITADLEEGKTQFSFGCDTMLGNDSTSGNYSDYAALEATVNADNTLNYVAMIGSRSSADASEDNPAFVITPVTEAPLFWIGHYGSREPFAFNTNSSEDGGTMGSVKGRGSDVTSAITALAGSDSGMTMSWMNVSSGGKVEFMFSVGDVKSTGAVKASVNYKSESIEGLEPNTRYIITILNKDNTPAEPVEAYTICSDSEGSIAFEGKDVSDDSYVLTGKNIKIEKEGSADEPRVETIGARPEAAGVETNDPGADTAAKPVDVKLSDATITDDTIVITINPSDDNAENKLNQEYRLVDANGTPLTGASGSWAKVDNSGKRTFTGLEQNTEYIIQARIPATAGAPASAIVEAAVKTAKTISITVPGGNSGTIKATCDGTPKSFPIIAEGGNNPKVAYSTGLGEAYTDKVPEFTAGGKYTVYYRITQDGSDTIYGSYAVELDPVIVFDINGGDSLNLTASGYATQADETSVAVSYGQKPEAVVAAPVRADGDNYFAGWYLDKKLKNLYWYGTNISSAAEVTQNMTLYARWISESELNTVTIDAASTPAGVTAMQLQQGGVPVPNSNWVSKQGDTFTFSGVPDGEYNLLLKKPGTGATPNQIITTKVRIENDTVIFLDDNVAFPDKNISTKVTAEAGAPSVAVSGLEKEIMEEDGNGNLIHWDFTGGELNPYSVLELQFSGREDMTDISQAEADANLNTKEKAIHTAETAISATAGTSEDLEFFDITIVRTDYWDGAVPEQFTISELQNAVEIAIPYDIPEGKTLRVFRYHDGVASAMTRVNTRPAGVSEYVDGTYFVGENVVYVYTKLFSIYGITSAGKSKSRSRKADVEETPVPAPVQEETVTSQKTSYDKCTEGEACPIWPFTDAKSTAWYHNGVHWALDNGVMEGFSASVFGPNEKTTRAQVAAMLYRLAGSPAGAKANAFTDVKEGKWYTDAIDWAAENGVITGWEKPDGSGDMFAPDAPVTREQLAAMIYRFSKVSGKAVAAGQASGLAFSDAASVSSWAKEAMSSLVSQGIITGIGSSLLDPAADASRAQVATMLMRYWEGK